MAELDSIIHQPVRLKIMAALKALPGESQLEFVKLKEVVGATEGPAYHDGYLYFTDGGPLNRMNWATGKAETFKRHSGSPNGLMFDPQGRLIACESDARRMVRYEKDGHKTILAGNYHGKAFNSPNDVTMDSHPAYTGEKRLVDTAGRVEKFTTKFKRSARR